MMDDDETFDTIVTGAGSAGAVVAARLSENPAHRVLLLEAGVADRNPWIHIPLGYSRLFANPKLNWMFESEPEPELHNRTMYQPRGKVLGGASSINGMIYMRGNPADYDEWRQRGCEGWDWDSVLPYFRKAEDQERGADEFHGVGGPLRVSNQPQRWELADAILRACLEAGIPRNDDFNGARQEGAGYYQTTTKNRRRWSTASAYLRPARGRANLTIRTQAHATRVLIENGRAVGVEYRTPVHLRPEGRGTVRIKSPDPMAAPEIRFNFLCSATVRIATAGQAFAPAKDRSFVSILPLFQDSVEQVRLEEWVPQARVNIPTLAGLELLVLAGSFDEQSEHFIEQSWLRLPPGSTFAGVAGPSGCRVWAKSGHLAAYTSGPVR
jgi:choline dehydrogenase-like flavoprotein